MLPFAGKRLNQFLLVLILFINARVLMLLALPADNLTLYGDYRYYFDLGRLFGDFGYWPFIHYWSEYPPLFPLLNLVVYGASGGIFKNFVVVEFGVDYHGGPFIDNRRALDEKPPGMKQGQNDEHDVIGMEFKKNIRVQTIKKCFAVG